MRCEVYTVATANGVKVTTFLEDLRNEYSLPYEYVVSSIESTRCVLSVFPGSLR
jgi:hypothetical protein